MARYIAVPVKDRHLEPVGWGVYPLPMGRRPPAARFRGPFAGLRAQARARKLSRADR
jgi:hypothetical protein